MKKTLAEGVHGTGVVSKGKIRRKLRIALRPKAHLIAGAGPVNWNKSFIPPKYTIKNQNGSFSCGGQAGSRFIEIAANLQIESTAEQSAKSIYALGFYSNGGGMTVDSLQHQICKAGSNNESEVSSSENGNPPSESFMTDKAWYTPEMGQKALVQAGWTPLTVKITMDSIAQAIQSYGAVIMEVQGENNGTWLSPYPTYPTKAEWAHYVCGYDYSTVNDRPQISFYNSWGKEVGDGGVQHFTESYIKSGYIIDVFTFAPDPKAQSLFTMQNLLIAYQKLLQLLKLKLLAAN